MGEENRDRRQGGDRPRGGDPDYRDILDPSNISLIGFPHLVGDERPWALTKPERDANFRAPPARPARKGVSMFTAWRCRCMGVALLASPTRPPGSHVTD